MNTPVTIRFFLTTERSQVRVGPGEEIVLRRSGNPLEIVLPDPSITRQGSGIARIAFDGEKLILKPAEEGTPVLINGTKVTEAQAINPGDRIRAGYSVFVVQAITEPEEAAEPDLRTIRLETVYVKKRDEMGADVERLAQWSEGFDAMKAAASEGEAAEVILHQLGPLAGSDRCLVALGRTSDINACRELAACGLHGGEVEEILRWFNQQTLEGGIATPLIKEVVTSDLPGRAAVGKVDMEDQSWLFYVEPAHGSPVVQAAYRARSVLGNLLQLYHLFGERQSQKKIVAELTHTVRLHARPPEEQDLQIVMQKFVFQTPGMRVVCRALARAAASASPVLILGEPGTGKQLAAEAIHAASNRRHRDMVSVSLTEYPETLLEGMLFGHEKGAYTGATKERMGLLASAHRSTLFLDEIGEIPSHIQAKLLRVLERGEFRRLGEHKITRVDVRLVTATNRDLAGDVRQGRFRQDLYDRINVIPVVLPPLRERLDDIPLLAAHFLAAINQREGKNVKLSDEGIRHLRRYTWPNNVRGLRNYLERAVALADPRQTSLGPDELPPLAGPDFKPAESAKIDDLIEALRQRGCLNQARLLGLFKESSQRWGKGELADQLQISRPVCRSELQKLIAFALGQGFPLAFFEQRITLRGEDWEKIKALQGGEA